MKSLALATTQFGVVQVCCYVKKTKTKRMMQRTIKKRIIMICPFALAFFMTIATFFWKTMKEQETKWANDGTIAKVGYTIIPFYGKWKVPSERDDATIIRHI